ncbi:MAG: hypothetical protein ACXVGH_08605 [Mycobacteriales bacterium]
MLHRSSEHQVDVRWTPVREDGRPRSPWRPGPCPYVRRTTSSSSSSCPSSCPSSSSCPWSPPLPVRTAVHHG